MIPHVLLVKWQIAVYILICLSLLVNIVSLGVRPKFHACPKSKLAFFAIVIYLSLQFVTWLPIYDNVNMTTPLKFNSRPEDIWRFIWAPMGSALVIWMYLGHVVKSCVNFLYDVEKTRVIMNSRTKRMQEFTSGGFVSTVLAVTLIPVNKIRASDLTDIMLGLAVGYIFIEVIIQRYRYNSLAMASPVVAWFFWTWLGLWFLSLI